MDLPNIGIGSNWNTNLLICGEGRVVVMVVPPS
jgi:hypothetical protein